MQTQSFKYSVMLAPWRNSPQDDSMNWNSEHGKLEARCGFVTNLNLGWAWRGDHKSLTTLLSVIVLCYSNFPIPEPSLKGSLYYFCFFGPQVLKAVVIEAFYEHCNCSCDVSIYKAEKYRMIETMRGGCEELSEYTKNQFMCTVLCEQPSTQMVLCFKTKVSYNRNGNVELMLPNCWLHKYRSSLFRLTQGKKNVWDYTTITIVLLKQLSLYQGLSHEKDKQ